MSISNLSSSVSGDVIVDSMLFDVLVEDRLVVLMLYCDENRQKGRKLTDWWAVFMSRALATTLNSEKKLEIKYFH